MIREQSENKTKSNLSNNNEPEGIAGKSHELAEQVKQATLGRVETFQQGAQSMRDNAAERVRNLSATVRKVGEHFRVEDQTYISEQMARASQGISHVADYIGEAELSSLVRDTRRVATRNPGLFLGGALVLGLGAGRFLKGTALVASGTISAQPKSAKTKSHADRHDADVASERPGSERNPPKNAANRSEQSRNRAR